MQKIAKGLYLRRAADWGHISAKILFLQQSKLSTLNQGYNTGWSKTYHLWREAGPYEGGDNLQAKVIPIIEAAGTFHSCWCERRTGPGAMQFTRMPFLIASWLRAFACVIMAPSAE